MKAMTYLAPKKLVVNEFPSRELKAGQVRIRTMYSGISHGTEMNIYRGVAPQWNKYQDGKSRLFTEPKGDQKTWQYPVNGCDEGVWWMGYAAVGEITEITKEVTDLKVGDIVYITAPHMSEITIAASECVKLPKGIDPKIGVFFNNLNTAFNGILDSTIKLGDIVVVSGLGVLGQLISRLAKKSGATVIGIDSFEIRRNTALKNGIDYVFAPSEETTYKIKEMTDFRGADLVIEASGSTRGLQEAVRMAAYDGNVTCISWYHGPYEVLDFSGEFHHNRVTIRTSHTCALAKELSTTWDMKRRWATCLKLLPELNLGDIITNVVPFEDAPKAYEQIDKHPEEVIQTVFKY